MPTITEPPALAGLHDLPGLMRAAEGFPPLLAALKNGHGATVDGAWGSSAALAAATIGLEAPRTLLVVIAHPRDTDGWVEDIAGFAGVRPAVFPAWENLPSSETVVDELATQRLRLLKQLQGPTPPRFVVTTVQALIQPVPDRAQLEQGRRVLRVGEQVEMEELAAWLV